jgi:peptide/nickel transport system substrate-binding protein/oligopeptide transport system substrate-binding protein
VVFLTHGRPSLLIAHTSSAEAAEPRIGGTFRRPLENDPLSLDPAKVGDNFGVTVMKQVFQGLVQYDDSLTPVPDIAETWRPSPDGRTWTFHLKRGVKFHHGREVTAEDVVYSLGRLLEPGSKSRTREVLKKIAGASEFTAGRAPVVSGLKASDRYVLEVQLTEPTPGFIPTLTLVDTMVVPREVVERLGDKFGEEPVGAGPFRFVRWVKGKEIVLEANRDHFEGRPYLDRVEFRIFPGIPHNEILTLFEKGLLEESYVPAKDMARVARDTRYQFVRRSDLRLRFFGISVTTRPLDNVKLRRALNYAIDQQAMAREIHQEKFTAAFGLLPPGVAGYDPRFRHYPHDPGKAKALLAEAGYPGGRGLLPIEIWSSVRTPGTAQEDHWIARYLAEVGIVAEMKYNTDWRSFRAQIGEGKLPIFRYGWTADIPDPDYFLYDLFSSQSPKNLFRYSNRDVDSLLHLARAEREAPRRTALYREAQSKILDDAPVILLSYGSFERVYQGYVRNLRVTALAHPYITMDRIWLDLPPGTTQPR